MTLQCISYPLLILAVVLSASYAVPIDNGVKGYPAVVCGSGAIQVELETKRNFAGRLYIKGEAHKKDCTKSFESIVYPADGGYGGVSPSGYGSTEHSNDYGSIHPPSPSGYSDFTGPVVGVDIKLGECNMQRKRTLYPRGVEYTFTLVASFHPLFLTKVDRAYRIRCFYMEAEKTVNSQIDVSMLTTKQVNEQYPMPQCRYHLKRGGPDGPYVRYAKVGDKVVHVWECDKSSGYVYGMLVKNCYVDDGQGNKVQLIDEKGCSIDRHLIPAIRYDDQLISAFVETHVFKYADKPHLLFTCTIQLCYKRDGGCYGLTPPKCGHNHDHGHEHGYDKSAGHEDGYNPPPQYPIPHPLSGPIPPPPSESYGGANHASSPPYEESTPYGHGSLERPPAYGHPQGGYDKAAPIYEQEKPLSEYESIRIPQAALADYEAGSYLLPEGVPPIAETYVGPYQPIGPKGSAHGLRGGGPYKDDPIGTDKANSTNGQKKDDDSDAKKHKIDAMTAIDDIKVKRAAASHNFDSDELETDLSAQPLIVLPFDDDLEEEDHLPSMVGDHRYLLSKQSVCLSPSGFGLALSLFIVSLLTTMTTVALFIRKYKYEPFNFKA